MTSIIVVVWNHWKLLRECLQSLREHTDVPYELILVNNGKPLPSSIRKLLRNRMGRQKQCRRVCILQNPKNLGYARAANQGALVAKGNYFCFLNTDTQVFGRWLQRLLLHCKKPRVGAVGPLGREGWGSPQEKVFSEFPLPLRGRMINELLSIGQSGHATKIDFLKGFCWVMPRKIWKEVGHFDERFVFYGEDADYALRLHERGYQTLRADDVYVYHQGGGSIPSNSLRMRRMRQAHATFRSIWAPRLKKRIVRMEDVFR